MKMLSLAFVIFSTCSTFCLLLLQYFAPICIIRARPVSIRLSSTSRNLYVRNLSTSGDPCRQRRSEHQWRTRALPRVFAPRLHRRRRGGSASACRPFPRTSRTGGWAKRLAHVCGVKVSVPRDSSVLFCRRVVEGWKCSFVSILVLDTSVMFWRWHFDSVQYVSKIYGLHCSNGVECDMHVLLTNETRLPRWRRSVARQQKLNPVLTN